MHNAVLREKVFILHRAKQNHMCFSPKIKQPVRSIEYSEGSLNLMNTIVLRDNIEKKRRILMRQLGMATGRGGDGFHYPIPIPA